MVYNNCYMYVSFQFRYYSYEYPKVPIYVSKFVCSASNDGGGVGNKRPDGVGVRFGLISMLAIISITKANKVTVVGSIERETGIQLPN